MQLVTLATCNLNQWALDFDGNLERILESLRIARERGARYRLGPELEITGYGCQDAFLESDTIRHSWESLAKILTNDVSEGMLCDIGMPVIHKGVRYNCRIFLLGRRILLIRPKMALAMGGNYREGRYFAPWQHPHRLERHPLPQPIREITGQDEVTIGDAAIATRDTVLASESCEELFTPQSPHIHLGLDGVEIFANGSASHHELRKLQQRVELIRAATAKGGGVYLYANQQGCDGGRLYYDGCAMIVLNGEVVAQGSQFSPRDVEVITATVDLEEVRSFRASLPSRMAQGSRAEAVPHIPATLELSTAGSTKSPSPPRAVHYHSPEEEIALGPACWLWDYLRRSRQGGFLLPLSGGADSAAVAALVGSMCQLVVREARAGNRQVASDLRRLTGHDQQSEWLPEDARELANLLLHSCYLASSNSTSETRKRARRIAREIGAYHLEFDIDRVVQAFLGSFETVSGKSPRFAVHGGSSAEDLALQNLQARSRLVFSYLLAQLLPWTRRRRGTLLVLATANVDEALRGYLTKYDPSSADLNPIGAISKSDLRSFLHWATDNLGYSSLRAVVEATPTAELEPPGEAGPQSDEVDMGMTYQELSRFGRLRKLQRCGPVAMFEKLLHEWDHLPPHVVAEKVKRFFRHYAVNRHKATVLTPAYHAENYSPDDHRFDLRQFLYNSDWDRQFRNIDELVETLERQRDPPEGPSGG